MKKRYSKEIKEELLAKVRSGHKISDVAQVHGIHQTTIRGWLEKDTGGKQSEVLEMSRLRRENEALMRIIGQLTYESEMQKKNQRRVRQ